MMDTVADGNVVKLHYTLTVEGKVVDNTREREALCVSGRCRTGDTGVRKCH